MKKNSVLLPLWKKAIFMLCIIILALLLFLIPNYAYAQEKDTIITCTSASDMALITYKNYNNGTVNLPTSIIGCIKYTQDVFFMGDKYNGPIGIVKGVLNSNGQQKDVYILTLSGTELIYDDETGIQSTGGITDLLQAFNFDNPYSKAIIKTVLENIPTGSNLLVYGHSLGGMVAQHIISERIIKNNYNVLNTVTYGSPLIRLFSRREGNVNRLCDKTDIVPFMSVYTLTPLILIQLFSFERKVEDGGYKCNELLDAHCGSYIRNDIWGEYDILGQKYGDATLTFDFAKTQYFPAPFCN